MLNDYDAMIPEGTTALLEGLSRAVLKKRPENVKLFALHYVTELKQYRRENPLFDLKKLVTEFHKSRAEYLLSVGLEEQLNEAGFRLIPAMISKEKATFPNQAKYDQCFCRPTLSKANKEETVFSNYVEGCNRPTNGICWQRNYAQQSQSKRREDFFYVSDHSPNRPRSANKQTTVPIIWGKDVELLRSAAKRFVNRTHKKIVNRKQTPKDSDNCTHCVMGDKPLEMDLGLEGNDKTHVKEEFRSSKGEAMKSSVDTATQGDHVELTTAAESSMRMETLCSKAPHPPTTKPRRVRFGAWDQVSKESSTRKTDSRPSGHRNENTYIHHLKPVQCHQFHEAGHTGRPTNYSKRDVHEASTEPNHLHNQEATWGGQRFQKSANFRKIFLPMRYEDNPSSWAEQSHYQEDACHHPLSQDYIYLEESAPMYYPGPQQCANVCPRVSPCHCPVPQNIRVPPCVIGRPQTTGGVKQTMRKPCETRCWNENCVLPKRTSCAPTTLESNYISYARGIHAMPRQEESGLKYIPVYIPMDVNSLPRNVRPVQSESYLSPNHVLEAEHGGTMRRRPCSAPFKRTLFATKLGGWQP